MKVIWDTSSEDVALWRLDFLLRSARWSSLHWPGALLMLLAALALIGCLESHKMELLNASALLLFLLLDLAVTGLQQKLKVEEIPSRVQSVINTLSVFLSQPEPELKDCYLNLFTPPSQSISVQWTYRDGRLVNLPVSLLVEGDIIALRPGQEAPASLRGIQEEEHVILDRGDVFCHFSSPPSPLGRERPRPHSLLCPHLFRVTRTPAIASVQKCLEMGSQRPITVLDNERFTAQTLLEEVVTPLVLAVLMIVNCTRYILGAPGIGPWQVTLLQLQVNGVLPLLPLTFPMLWLQVSAFGEAQVLTYLKTFSSSRLERCLETWRTYFRVLCGRSPALCHTTSLLHSLGSITVLCCVDKQGILSWPNPNTEKVLFFTRNPQPLKPGGWNSKKHVKTSDRSHKPVSKNPSTVGPQTNSSYSGSTVEVLSLSLDRQAPTCMQFDDSCWQRYATSLRPLGLCTVVGLCDPVSVATLWQLTDHLTNVALLKSRPSCLPVQMPWGMCELARVIGFSPSAKDPFQQQMSSAAYTLTSAQEGSPWQPQPVAMRKLPLTHIISLLIHDSNTGKLQLFSYGSADAVLEACSECWDGTDIQTLSSSDRSKVLDFYQRACIAGQCLALSFKPMFHALEPEINGKCIQLPRGMCHSYRDQEGKPKFECSAGEEDPLLSLDEQVFLGLVSTQYQARPEMVRLIAGLDSACIRFVYFSLEEEVKSKVFAEKMGLETGWNCHISLQSDRFPLDPEDFQDTVTLCSEREVDSEGGRLLSEGKWQAEKNGFLDGEGVCFIEDRNRAKLPKGIENVRPHLENIDNVPLLVPLFTDCTPETMCEMVEVMQEYGEVVCCLGSVLNFKNNAVFLQSDISIALDPLFPSCCWSSPGRSAPLVTSRAPQLFSVQLSSALCGLPCAIHLGQHDNTTIIRLIKQARHSSSGIRKCFLFLLQCQLSLVLIQILACLSQLPPPLGTADVLWLSCISFPILGISLLGKSPDNTIMEVATGKNLTFLPKKTQQFFIFYFLLKFGLTMCSYLACFGFMLHAFCMKTHPENGPRCHPYALLINSNETSPAWYGEYYNALLLAQKIIAFFMLLNGLCTSVSHVHRSSPLWRQSPLSNRWWCAAVIIAPSLQVLMAYVAYLLWRDPSSHLTSELSDVPAATWLLGFLWLLPLLFVNESIKLHEIRTRVRYLKRQKLQFDTKLGMNSPF
ncbi:transmembrane protein 94-like [Acipenser oxyrinchus oxyrinchus]|uniref:Transmembrane protein 94-like n=1 Tax=Acipenser oxyrinchus oxyrinchus TaxID=40147 RepID=A0AAD8D665_ACIOX|nr:transmembrane protein 94-like [Acipenser oxyrinchus oxyrinchus]